MSVFPTWRCVNDKAVCRRRQWEAGAAIRRGSPEPAVRVDKGVPGPGDKHLEEAAGPRGSRCRAKLRKRLLLPGLAQPGGQQQERAEMIFRLRLCAAWPIPFARIHSRNARVESPNSTFSLSSQTEPHGGAGGQGPINRRCRAGERFIAGVGKPGRQRIGFGNGHCARQLPSRRAATSGAACSLSG